MIGNIPYAAAQRMAQIDAFEVMEVQRRAHALEAAGKKVIHMEIGQPDFGAPPAVVAAGIAALQSRTLGYTDALGIPELRRALSDFYRNRFGVEVPAERIIVTAGASGALVLAVAGLVNPGDEVLITDPGYPCYRHFVRVCEGAGASIEVDASQHYQPTLDDVKRHWSARTRGLILASPANPPGTIIEQQTLVDISRWVQSQGGFLIVDEIYQGLVYGRQPETVLTHTDEALVINSFSKYFCMTGWRLGWMVVPEAIRSDMEKLAQNLFICPSAPAQYAALAAFSPESIEVLEARRREYQQRRDWLVPRLRELGFDVPHMPEGAFYVYAGCGRFAADSQAFAARVLEEAHVAITPGMDFGFHRSASHVRFAYTRSLADLQEGMARLEKMLRA